MASLAGVLFWLTAYSDHGSISISGQSFVVPDGSLALSVVMELRRDRFQGRLVRRDKGRQFEWQVYDDDLQDVAKLVHRIASHTEDDDYYEVNLSPDSDAKLDFLVDPEQVGDVSAAT